MNMIEKINRRNVLINVVTALLSTSIAAYSFAEEDYGRIKKDINVMIGIVKSSFADNSNCNNCRVRITGHYLADQGAVFNVNPTNRHQYVSSFETLDSIVMIPGMVQDILQDVQININEEDMSSWDWHSESDERSVSREGREEMRELRHELRELSREMREIEIEAIHTENDDLEELKDRESELEQEIATVEKKRDKVQESISSTTEQRNKEREAKQLEHREQRRKEFVKMESVLLNTFCDYSSTMRNLPDDEKVSIIVDKSDDTSNIYMFKQSDLQDCDSEKENVRDHALSYAF